MIRVRASGVGSDNEYKKLHDNDPTDYHAKLAKHHVACGFCERKKTP